MPDQFDLFALAPSGTTARPAQIASPTLLTLLPRRPFQWERRLAAADADLPLELMVCQLWTGVVVEVLSVPEGRTLLHSDGQIQEGVPPDGRSYRLVFLLPDQVRRIARRVALNLLGTPGSTTIHLAAATSLWPGLADWLDGIEAAEPQGKKRPAMEV